MSDESIDGSEPKLWFRKTLEGWTTGIGRHVKVKAPNGRKCASVAFGLHDDELDPAVPIPVEIFRQQSGPEPSPTPLRTPNPEFSVGTTRAARVALPTISSLPSVTTDKWMNRFRRSGGRSARPRRWKIISLASAISALISRTWKLSPPEREAQIAFQQSVADRSDSVVFLSHFMKRSIVQIASGLRGIGVCGGKTLRAAAAFRAGRAV
jgi:hypothetical protein